MPIFVFDNDKLYVVFDDPFQADMHEWKFMQNPSYHWRRTSYGKLHVDDLKGRGNAFVTDNKGAVFANIRRLFE